jgi:hypothetical protein
MRTDAEFVVENEAPWTPWRPIAIVLLGFAHALAGDDRHAEEVLSPTLSIASTLAALTVRSSSWRAWTASAIAVRCWSSSPAAIWSSKGRSDSPAGLGGGMRSGRDAGSWGWT